MVEWIELQTCLGERFLMKDFVWELPTVKKIRQGRYWEGFYGRILTRLIPWRGATSFPGQKFPGRPFPDFTTRLDLNNILVKSVMVVFSEPGMAEQQTDPAATPPVDQASQTSQPLPSWPAARERETLTTGFRQFTTALKSSSTCHDPIRFVGRCFLHFFHVFIWNSGQVEKAQEA